MKLPTGININMIASELHSMPSARPPPPAHHLDFDKWSERKFASKWEMANIKIIYDPLVRIPSKRRWTAWSKYNRFSYIFLLTQMYHSTWAFIHFFFFSPLLFVVVCVVVPFWNINVFSISLFVSSVWLFFLLLLLLLLLLLFACCFCVPFDQHSSIMCLFMCRLSSAYVVG